MKNINIVVEKEKMLVNMCGKVDTTNAGGIQETIKAALDADCNVSRIVVDAKELEYISSAGLRVLLYCRKRIGDFTIINVSRDVYDILYITGFVNILNVKRALREVSIEGLEMIGQGTCGKVYREDAETIIKVFNEGFEVEKIETERENSQKAFINGIDTAISYDIVKVGNQTGVVYEMLNADTFRSIMQKDSERIIYYIEIYARFIKNMHDIRFEEGIFSSIKAKWYRSIDDTMVYSHEEKQAVKNMIGAVEDRNTFIHGDCNVGNVMYQNGSAILIDMADASVGHPIFDLAGIYLSFVLFPSLIPEKFCEKITGFSKKQNAVIWNKFCEVYFEVVTEQERIEYEEQIKPFAAFRVVQASSAVSVFPDEIIQYCRKIVLDANKDNVHMLEF